jgi:hypothetical protein
MADDECTTKKWSLGSAKSYSHSKSFLSIRVQSQFDSNPYFPKIIAINILLVIFINSITIIDHQSDSVELIKPHSKPNWIQAHWNISSSSFHKTISTQSHAIPEQSSDDKISEFDYNIHFPKQFRLNFTIIISFNSILNKTFKNQFTSIRPQSSFFEFNLNTIITF